ncbi:MAG: N-acetylmuramoyl-L-alanine amidase [Acidiferrobacteraceae bacterium]|nr:N-acetylmuramoyl-L-alanine amidase [Acidiferrobacteraceae bacterium]
MTTVFHRLWPAIRASLVIIIAGWSPGVYSESGVTDVRFWYGPDKTRLVLELTSAATYRVFSLDNPERVVIDIDQGRLDQGVELAKNAGGPVANIRSGRPEPGIFRIVLDVRVKLGFHAFLLNPSGAYPHRLVVDLLPKENGGEAHSVQLDLREEDYLVVIDPGHGGEDPGAIGGSGAYEKDVALEIARRLKRIINWDGRMRAILTRADDYYVSLRRRVEFSMERNADLFLSVHADAAQRKSAEGASVYILSTDGASSEMGKWLAQRENAADLAGGVDIGQQDPSLQKTLLDMGLDWKIRESYDLGLALLGSLEQVGGLHSRTVGRAGFAVLKAVDIPAVLIETGFMTNPAEEQALQQDLTQERIAGAIYRGLSAYCDEDERCPPRNRNENIYVVAPGDSLALIAARLGVSVADLKRENPNRSRALQIGQKLKVPL